MVFIQASIKFSRASIGYDEDLVEYCFDLG
jgi:hypothetical protein